MQYNHKSRLINCVLTFTFLCSSVACFGCYTYQNTTDICQGECHCNPEASCAQHNDCKCSHFNDNKESCLDSKCTWKKDNIRNASVVAVVFGVIGGMAMLGIIMNCFLGFLVNKNRPVIGQAGATEGL